VVNQNNVSNIILKTQPHQSLECQTLVFDDKWEHITLNQIFEQTFNIVLFMTHARNLTSVGRKIKPN
jgi:hypothetical protein